MATSPAPDGAYSNPCAYAGYQLDFERARLQKLYRTHQDYVRLVTKTAHRLERQGFLLPADARELINDARSSDALR